MDGLKQRIIGALVLISLAVIFVPMLFDEPRQERTTQPVDIPEEPSFPEVSQPGDVSGADATASGDQSSDFELEERSANEGGADDETSTTMGAENDPEPAGDDPAPETAEVDVNADKTSAKKDAGSSDSGDSEEAVAEEGDSKPASSSEFSEVLEGAWLVQIGSFGNRDNATGMRDRIREAGYDAHLQQIDRGGTTLTRVFSGPFASEAMAKDAKKSLDDAFSVNSLVVEGSP